MTNKQIQNLLAYLGYYVGEIDGIIGQLSVSAIKTFQKDYNGLEINGKVCTETQKALKHAVAFGMPAKTESKNFWDKIAFFDREEFRCKCGGKYCDGFPVEPEKKLVTLADRVRKHFGAAAIVSSGVRCETHNANVGGVSGSRHKYGTAMDFCVRDISSAVLLEYIQKQPETNYAYAIDGNYVHMDVIK